MSRPTPAPDRDAGRHGPGTNRGALLPWSSARSLALAAALCAGAALVPPPTDAAQPSPEGETSATTTAPPSVPSDIGPAPTATVQRPVPHRGAGTTTVLAVPGRDSGRSGRTVRYTVEVEDGAGVDGAEFAATVRRVLTDERGWEVQDGIHFVHVPPEEAASHAPDVRITLASPATTDDMCAPLDTGSEVSCRNGNRVAINSVRWTQGVPYYPDDLAHYRIYVVNHEVGHYIGHDHEGCAAPGKQAPVMMQQTLGLQGCTRYPWAVPGKAL